MRLTNPGTSGNICAAIYVFDPNQEISECCSCLLSPDGLRTLSVNTDLTGAPLTGVMLTTGSIEIVSTPPFANGVCPALPTSLSPQPAIRAWATHIQNGTFAITETPSQDATLSSAEERRIEGECYAIQLDSGRGGQCTCGTGDLVLSRPIVKSHLSQKLTGLTLQDSSLAPKSLAASQFWRVNAFGLAHLESCTIFDSG